MDNNKVTVIKALKYRKEMKFSLFQYLLHIFISNLYDETTYVLK